MQKAKAVLYFSLSILTLAVAFHLGLPDARPAAASPTPSEVAVLAGTIGNGDVIPLPVYADGSVASESECHWTVSIATTPTEAGGSIHCYTEGRTVYVGENNPRPEVSANYMIVAVRGSPPAVATKPVTWGRVKADRR